MSYPLDLPWVASDYLDMGNTWGVLTKNNHIVIGFSVGLSREQCEAIAKYHNVNHLGMEESK
jgi:hypothetical protein